MILSCYWMLLPCEVVLQGMINKANYVYTEVSEVFCDCLLSDQYLLTVGTRAPSRNS